MPVPAYPGSSAAAPAYAVVPFPDTTMPGIRPQESSGRIINGYTEPLGTGAPNQMVYRRAPGLSNFGTTTRSGFRGGVEIDGTIYTAFLNRLVSFSEAGGPATDIGILAGTSKGFFASNNKSPIRDIVFCDPDGNYCKYQAGGTISMNYDTDLPIPNSVCSIDGFFVFTIGDGRLFASDLNDTNINALSFGTAENKPDGLIRAIPWSGNLLLFGQSTCEVWSNAGTTPFPFARALVIPRGIAGPYCVAAFEDNFSRALVWVADDNTVCQLQGYNPQIISPADLNGLIEQVMDKRQLEMSVYASRGHAFVILSSPTWSWVYDLNTNKWAERASYLQTRSRITGGWYGANKWLVGDTAGGNVQQIDSRVHTEVDPVDISKTKPFRWRLESGAVEKFPVGARVGRFDAQFVTGVGQAPGIDPIQTNPVVEISWSDDGGQTYYAPLIRPLGRQSITRQLVSLISCTGRSTWVARRWRLDITDPVHIGFMGATQNISPRVSDMA